MCLDIGLKKRPLRESGLFYAVDAYYIVAVSDMYLILLCGVKHII